MSSAPAPPHTSTDEPEEKLGAIPVVPQPLSDVACHGGCSRAPRSGGILNKMRPLQFAMPSEVLPGPALGRDSQRRSHRRDDRPLSCSRAPRSGGILNRRDTEQISHPFTCSRAPRSGGILNPGRQDQAPAARRTCSRAPRSGGILNPPRPASTVPASRGAPGPRAREGFSTGRSYSSAPGSRCAPGPRAREGFSTAWSRRGVGRGRWVLPGPALGRDSQPPGGGGHVEERVGCSRAPRSGGILNRNMAEQGRKAREACSRAPRSGGILNDNWSVASFAMSTCAPGPRAREGFSTRRPSSIMIRSTPACSRAPRSGGILNSVVIMGTLR